jgi:hypothetical protein
MKATSAKSEELEEEKQNNFPKEDESEFVDLEDDSENSNNN